MTSKGMTQSRFKWIKQLSLALSQHCFTLFLPALRFPPSVTHITLGIKVATFKHKSHFRLRKILKKVFEMADKAADEVVEEQEYDVSDVVLLQAVKNSSLLWDSREQEFRNQQKKTVLWNQLAVELQIASGGKILLNYFKNSNFKHFKNTIFLTVSQSLHKSHAPLSITNTVYGNNVNFLSIFKLLLLTTL